jgi:PEP-CTERM motif
MLILRFVRRNEHNRAEETMRKIILWLCAGASLLWLLAIPAFSNSMPMFTECPAVGQDAGCQVLITINPGGSLSFQTDPSQPSFDPSGGVTLVGVLNDSGTPQQSINLSGNGIFAFDGEGACSGMYNPSPARCSGPLLGFNAPTTYEGYDKYGNFDSFTVLTLDSGAIFFANQLTPSDSAFFSLQGTPSDISGVVPEPASILLMTTGLLSLLFLLRKSKGANSKVL